MHQPLFFPEKRQKVVSIYHICMQIYIIYNISYVNISCTKYNVNDSARFARMKCHDGFSNLHLFKQINIDLIFTDCILYLLHRGCTFLYARSTYLATRRIIWQIITIGDWGNRRRRRRKRRRGQIDEEGDWTVSIDRIINEIRRIGLETSLTLSQCNIKSHKS